MGDTISNISTVLTAMLGWITQIFNAFMANEIISTYIYFLLAMSLILLVVGIIFSISNKRNK